MADQTSAMPASLQVYRYRAGADRVEAVIGTLEPELPQEDLVAHATEALERETFMCYAVSQPDDFVADELCFVPQGDHCDILSIRTNGWERHHGDHRRSLVEILNNLAAAVACGKLRILDTDQVGHARSSSGDRSSTSRSATPPSCSGRGRPWTTSSSRPASTTSTASGPSCASRRP